MHIKAIIEKSCHKFERGKEGVNERPWKKEGKREMTQL